MWVVLPVEGTVVRLTMNSLSAVQTSKWLYQVHMPPTIASVCVLYVYTMTICPCKIILFTSFNYHYGASLN